MYRCADCGNMIEDLPVDEYGNEINECPECGSDDLIEIQG